MADASVAAWPLEAIAQLVVPLLPGFVAEVVPTMDSTNSELMRRARAGRRGPVLLVAERQTAGRGRLGRSWHSDVADTVRGSLTFSLALPLARRDLSGLSLAVGVGVARCLHPQLRLKWPNDIWLRERKLAGILIETAAFDGNVVAVIGIGINIGLPSDAAQWALPPAALDELLAGATAPDVLRRVVPALVQDVLLFEAHGFAPFHAAFQARDVLSGRAVVLSDGSTGTAAGVDGAGALLVHTSAGMKSITSAEVSVRPAPVAGPGV